jgi:hypothetical protein
MTQIIKVTEPLLQIIERPNQGSLIIQSAPVQINSGLSSKQAALPFGYGDVTTQTIYALTAGQRITRVEIGFDVAFNVASTISVGDSGNTQRLMTTGQNNPLLADTYSSHPFYKYASNTNILLTLNAGIGATQGSGVVIVYYE